MTKKIWETNEIKESIIANHPELQDRIEDHSFHSAADCEALIGNPGVGDDFDSLKPIEQKQLQDIVDSIRIHLAVLEESAQNTNKQLEGLSKEIKNVRADAKSNYTKSSECLNELNDKVSDIDKEVSGLSATQRIMWAIISTLLFGFVAQVVAFGFWVIQQVIKSGIF